MQQDQQAQRDVDACEELRATDGAERREHPGRRADRADDAAKVREQIGEACPGRQHTDAAEEEPARERKGEPHPEGGRKKKQDRDPKARAEPLRPMHGRRAPAESAHTIEERG